MPQNIQCSVCGDWEWSSNYHHCPGPPAPKPKEKSIHSSEMKPMPSEQPVEQAKPKFTELNPPERTRTYFYPDGGIQFEGVTRLAVSKSGYHRLETQDGMRHIVAPGWLSIALDVDDWTF